MRSESEEEASHRIIDMVEQVIRKVHPFIDRFANTLEGRTLLHGEVYYDLENSIADMLSR